ncbi:hypothetical protein C5615_36570 [Burkholderia cepacia]|uniref:Uncharacterized protein n=1 Tax=Burkholderia cepacia TaxID=292 RepID=A0A2S8I0H9_BURCE|nr:hypothetical protein C5615_36570 [Burkholderia cepacia]
MSWDELYSWMRLIFIDWLVGGRCLRLARKYAYACSEEKFDTVFAFWGAVCWSVESRSIGHSIRNLSIRFGSSVKRTGSRSVSLRYNADSCAPCVMANHPQPRSVCDCGFVLNISIESHRLMVQAR